MTLQSPSDESHEQPWPVDRGRGYIARLAASCFDAAADADHPIVASQERGRGVRLACYLGMDSVKDERTFVALIQSVMGHAPQVAQAAAREVLRDAPDTHPAPGSWVLHDPLESASPLLPEETARLLFNGEGATS